MANQPTSLTLRYVFGVILVLVIGILIARILKSLPVFWGTDMSDILAVLAISFAAIQFIDARLQKRDLKVIAKSMSTRFIGLFPKNLDDITEVISKATRNIYIMADYVDYGHYSSPAAFDEYKEKLKTALKQKDITVQVICYNKETADEELKLQFPDDSFNMSDEERRKFEAYFSYHKGVARPNNAAELRAFLAGRQDTYIREWSDFGADFHYFPRKAEFFLWLEDEEEAVFVFKGNSPGQEEVSFRTQDTSLIEQFKKIFEQRWEDSRECYGEKLPGHPEAVDQAT